MAFELISQQYFSREWRGPPIFMCHWSGEQYPPNWYSNYMHSWLPVSLPTNLPPQTKQIKLYGEFVGGVLEGKTSFMMHLDIRDPLSTTPLPAGDDWTANGGQGDFYCDFQTPGVRMPIGEFWFPVGNNTILLRWKLEPPNAYYDGAWGLNLWAQGFGW